MATKPPAKRARGRPVTTGTTPAKDRTAKTRAGLAKAGGKRLDVYLDAQGAADLVEIIGREGVNQTEATHRALRFYVESM